MRIVFLPEAFWAVFLPIGLASGGIFATEAAVLELAFVFLGTL